jgi:autotransporter passenger strand-loop-strand repeat protein
MRVRATASAATLISPVRPSFDCASGQHHKGHRKEQVMIINVTFDPSVSPAGFDSTNLLQGAAKEAQFKNAINYVVDLYEHLLTNDVTVNINVGWGEVGGSTITKGSATNTSHGLDFTYAEMLQSLTSNAQSYLQRTAYNTLPIAANSPFGTGTSIRVTTAHAKALGLLSADEPASDGSIGFNSSDPWSFDLDSTTKGTYDLVAAAEHEVSEVLGRVSGAGRPNQHNNNNPCWTPMDFFRYSAPGTRDTQANNGSAYFSIDEGKSNLGNWNNVSSDGDLGDWVYEKGPVPGGYDAFGFDGGPNGKTGLLTTTDVMLMNVIGWNTNDLPATLNSLEIVSEGVTDYVASGQTASGLILEGGGQQFIVSGGSATGTVASAGGLQDIRNGAIATGAQILDGGIQRIESGGVADETEVQSGGLQEVESGGSAIGTLLAQDGTQNIYAGAIVTDDGFNGGTQYVLSGATVTGVTIPLGIQNVVSGGAASGTVLETGGVQNISAGGIAVDTALVGGKQNVYGTAVDTVFDGGTQDVWPGATVIGANVLSGIQHVFSGGTASGTVLGSSGTQNAGGNVIGTAFRGGTQYVLSGATVSGAVIGSGTQHVEGGGEASGTILDGGTQSISGTTITLTDPVHGTVVIRGNAVGTVVNGGVQHVEAGGMAIGSILNGGTEYVESGGTAYTTVIGAGTLEVKSGGAVDAVTFAAGGNGTLRLDASANFLPDSVTIAGFAGQNRLDLADIDFGASTKNAFTEAPNSTSGSLTVTDGTRTTKLLFLGQYTVAGFAMASDGHGGTLITV